PPAAAPPSPVRTETPRVEATPQPKVKPRATPEPSPESSPEAKPTRAPKPTPRPRLTPTPKPSPTPLLFELSGWEAIDDGGHAALQVRFAINKPARFTLLNPDGQEVGTSPLVQPIERQVTIRMGATGRTPKPGLYQLYTTDEGRLIPAREIRVEGPRLALRSFQFVSQPLPRNQFSVRGIRFALHNSGDVPAYFDRLVDVKILGTPAKFTLPASPRVAPRQEVLFEASGNASPFSSDSLAVELTLTVQSDSPSPVVFSSFAGIP
ncbi:MAG: hypothetical protein HY673_17080, partial [Chloroflexi bacterium]|nr:hypothetical protein [Chloroflexota bacterium]